MSSTKGKKYGRQWLVASVTALIVPLIGIALVAFYNTTTQPHAATEIAGYFWWICMASAVFSVFCVFKLHRWLKVIPIIGLVVGVTAGLLLRASYWIGGMAG